MLSRLDAQLDPARLFAGFEHFSGLLLAVSGGPDSLALMHLAAQWRDRSGGVPLSVATVDHGLRANSGAEAEQVGEWAAALGLPHQILVWRGEKPARAIQEKAREARYRLLFAHAREIGAQAVATAHHADDQWETILFRLARGSGLGGLAGMTRDRLFPEGRLVRPLLDAPKQLLLDFCHARGQTYFTDPANGNPSFARTKLRALAAPLHDLGFTRERAQKLAERAQKADEAIDGAAHELFRRTFSPENHVYHLGDIGNAPRATLERFLALALTRVAGAPPRRLDRVEALAATLSAALANNQGCRATLGGCAVALTTAKILTLKRESPRRRGKTSNG